jgi:hypothetical protein
MLLNFFRTENSPAVRWYVARFVTDKPISIEFCSALIESFCNTNEPWPLRKRIGDLLLAIQLPPIHVTTLISTLDDGRRTIRWRAAELLRHVEVDRKLIPTIAQILIASPCKHVRWRLAELLRQSGARSPQALTAILHGSSSKDHWVQWHSLDVLRTSYNVTDLLALLTSIPVQQDSKLQLVLFQELCRCHPPDLILSVIEESFRLDSDQHFKTIVVNGLRRRGVASIYVDPILHALDSSHLMLRASAAQTLGYTSPTPAVIQGLEQRVENDVPLVAMWAATSLIRLGHASAASVKLLLPYLTGGSHGLIAWNAITMAIQQDETYADILSTHNRERLFALMVEAIAQGVLPTIGIKHWTAAVPVAFPARNSSNRSTDIGVYHSWESHARRRYQDHHHSMIQVCLHADWFPGIHLIWVADYILRSGDLWDFRKSPASIDRREVGFLLQGGGNLGELDGMRTLRTPKKSERIDFLLATNSRIIQYLVFAGLCAYNRFTEPTPSDSSAARIWATFASAMRDILFKFDLEELAAEEWFLSTAWHSSHYLARYERSYAHIRPGLIRLGEAITSSDTGLRESVDHLVATSVIKIESALWFQGLGKYPDRLLRIFALDSMLSAIQQLQ